jgi:uncharacterized protein (TIGR03382 family)
VSYVDAGYTIALVVLTLYALSLVLRRRRLTRAVSVQAAAGVEPPGTADPDRTP